MAGPVTLEYKGKLAIITINNEAKLNALSQDGYYQLASHMREVAENKDTFITILTGKGRFFSAYVGRKCHSFHKVFNIEGRL